MSRLLTVLKYEFFMHVRNRWFLFFIVLFGGLTIGISYYGLTFVGYEAGFQDFYRTTASLLNLVLMVVPLSALIAGHQSFSSESSFLEFLAAQPVSRKAILLGKCFGIFLTLCIPILLGLSAGGIVIALKVESEGLFRYFIFIGVSLVITMVFVALSALISVLAKRKSMAVVTGIIVWFFFFVIYDGIVLTVSYYIEEAYLRPFLYYSIVGNPIDIARTLVLMAVGGESALGVAGAGLLRTYGGKVVALICGISLLVLWILIPMLIALWLFRREDLV